MRTETPLLSSCFLVSGWSTDDKNRTKMARKHHNRDSGVLVFDSRTNTVMADELNPENIKQKISAIREVVLNRSNNEIVLVLQYHDYDVDKAIASFMEDGAAQVLKEWNFTGKKSNNKKKKKKNKAQQSQHAQQPAPQTEAPKEDDTSSTEAPTEGSVNLDLVTTATAKSDDMHSPTSPSIESGIEPDSVPNESAVDPVVLDSMPNGPVPVTHDPSSLPIGVPPSQDPVLPEASLSQGPEVVVVEGSADEGTKRKSGKTNPGKARGKGRSRRLNSPSRLSVSSDRVRTISESSNRSQASSHAAEKGAAGSTKRPASLDKGGSGKKPGAGLERSVKDLQRSTVSLQRYRNLLNEEIDASVKRIQTAFQELHQRLDDREVALMLELDHVKAQAIEILSKRQQQAVDLKVRTARAPTMTEAQLSELRADIKHFISDRKVDEEIGKTTRFARDQHTMLNTIDTFGEVVPVKCVYSTRRPSLSSVSSINTTSSVSEPPTPTSPSRPFPPSPTANQKDEVFDSLVTTGSVTVTTAPGMSTAEMVELQHRLQENLRQQVRPMGISTASPERRRPHAGSAPPQGPGRDRDRTNQNRDRASQGQQANRDRGVGPVKGRRNQDRTGPNQGRTGQGQNRNQDRAGSNQGQQNRNRAGQNRPGSGQTQAGTQERTQDGQNRERAGNKPSGQDRAGSGAKQDRTEQKRDGTKDRQDGTELKQGGKGQNPDSNKPTEPRQDQGQRQNRDRGTKDRGANSGQQGNREQGTESPQRSGRNQRRRDRDRRDARRTNDSQDSANQSQDSGPKSSGQERKPQSAAPSAGPSGDSRPVDSKPAKAGVGAGQSPSRQRNQSPRHNQPRNQHHVKAAAPKVNGSVDHAVQNGPKAPEKDMNGPSAPSDALPQRKPKQRGGVQSKEQPNAIPNGVPAPEGTATTNGDWE
ncbi:spermatogenesis-associated serine-rich protein 2-like isoform X4 [Branchiostoma floridae]|uniref:Spermatogenesis-associated serine-rich protein 2-like isoform X4 n=1 Tax=Branchiostoma floridae TaxID=7739 RepID=A0A9J7HRG1_BRAFL|nr:spermatogenesis-associated serine-rich protein 2-like isoform X4 [Branchiostoma floridae]